MRRLAAFATAALALAACQQTVHLFEGGTDGGVPGTGGKSGKGGTGGIVDAGTPDGRCSDFVSVTPDNPAMVVLLDRSTNMNDRFGSLSQLDAVLAALEAQVEMYKSIRFSFIAFPDQGGGCQSSASCCAGDPENDWRKFNSDVYACEGSPAPPYCVSSSSRPAHAALIKADAILNAPNGRPPGQRYVLLISDGAPGGNCAAPTDCQAAITDVGTLLDHKITVTMIGIQSDLDCLQFVNTGGQSAVVPVGDASTLGGVLNGVTQSAVCNATLSPPPQSASDLHVTYGGSVIPPDPVNGWTYDSTYGRLRLRGAACQNVLAGWSSLRVTATCGRSGSSF